MDIQHGEVSDVSEYVGGDIFCWNSPINVVIHKCNKQPCGRIIRACKQYTIIPEHNMMFHWIFFSYQEDLLSSAIFLPFCIKSTTLKSVQTVLDFGHPWCLFSPEMYPGAS